MRGRLARDLLPASEVQVPHPRVGRVILRRTPPATGNETTNDIPLIHDVRLVLLRQAPGGFSSTSVLLSLRDRPHRICLDTSARFEHDRLTSSKNGSLKENFVLGSHAARPTAAENPTPKDHRHAHESHLSQPCAKTTTTIELLQLLPGPERPTATPDNIAAAISSAVDVRPRQESNLRPAV